MVNMLMSTVEKGVSGGLQLAQEGRDVGGTHPNAASVFRMLHQSISTQ
jgi:hypothetical protein